MDGRRMRPHPVLGQTWPLSALVLHKDGPCVLDGLQGHAHCRRKLLHVLPRTQDSLMMDPEMPFKGGKAKPVFSRL